MSKVTSPVESLKQALQQSKAVSRELSTSATKPEEDAAKVATKPKLSEAEALALSGSIFSGKDEQAISAAGGLDEDRVRALLGDD